MSVEKWEHLQNLTYNHSNGNPNYFLDFVMEGLYSAQKQSCIYTLKLLFLNIIKCILEVNKSIDS